jgi:hypothetical protein
MSYFDFALHLLPVEADSLDRHARKLLEELGMADEPMTWSPPIGWVDLEGLPGPDPDSVDAGQVGELLRRQASPSDVAEQLGISLDHLRVVIRRNPQDLRRPARRVLRNPVPSSLHPERLRELIVDDNKTIRSLSREFGLSRKTMAGAVRREGLPIPPAHKPTVHIVDPAWLRTEYVDRRRTLPDLAAEIGTTPTNVSLMAKRHGIPLRERGGASHHASLNAPAGFPEPLASAVRGQGGIGRVERFQVFARTPSLNQAGGILGVSMATISTQLTKLETACGGPLLVRSPRTHQPQQLTPLGRGLLAQADQHLGPHRCLLWPTPRSTSGPTHTPSTGLCEVSRSPAATGCLRA